MENGSMLHKKESVRLRAVAFDMREPQMMMVES